MPATDILSQDEIDALLHGVDQGEVEMLGRRWRVEVTRTATDDPDLIAVEIAVSREGGASSLARLSGFLDAEASA